MLRSTNIMQKTRGTKVSCACMRARLSNQSNLSCAIQGGLPAFGYEWDSKKTGERPM